MPDYNLGTARGRIVTDYDGRGVAAARRDMTGLSKESKKTKKAFENVAAGAGVASLAIAAGLGYAANKAIQFEKQISAIGAVSGATKDELELLRKKALQLGSDTAFSASEAALGMEELAKAGVSTTDILGGAADAAVALAAAGGVELATAAEIAANAMGVFNLKAADLAHVADQIAGAANASAISVTDFNESMKQAGAISNLVGVSFHDMAIALALLGRNGVKGSDAGTSLKTMLANLQPTTHRQIELAKKLGIITADGSNKFFDQTGKLKSLAEVSQILQESMKGQSKQAQTLALDTLFGSDAIRAAAILSKDGAKGFNEMAAAMGKVSAQDVAQQRLDNVAGSIEMLKGTVETAAITIGTVFLPVIKRVADFINNLVDRFNNLDPKWQKLIAFALAGAAALAGLIAAIAGIGFAVIGLGAALAAVKIAAIVAGIVAAIAAVAAGIVLLYKRSESFRNALATIFAVVADHIRKTRAIIQPFIDFVRNTLIPMLGAGIKKAISNLRPAFEAVSRFVNEKLAPALQTFREALASAMPTIIKIAQFLGQVLVGAWNAVSKAIAFVVPILLKVAGFIFPLLINAISFLVRNIPTFVAVLQTIWQVLKTIGTVIGVAVIGPLYLLWQAAKAVFSGVMTALGILKAAWEASWAVMSLVIKTVFGPVWSLITTIVKGIVDAIMWLVNFTKPVWKGVWEFVKAVFQASWNTIKTVAVGAWNYIKSVIQGGVNAIKSIINGVKEIVTKIRTFFGDMKGAAEGGVSSLLKFVTTIPGKILSGLGDLGSLLYNAGKNVVQGFINGIKSMVGAVGDAAKGLVSKVTDFLPGSPAKEGPLSGQGYAKIRGQHLAQDVAAGVIKEVDGARAAMEMLMRNMAVVIPPSGSEFTTQHTLNAAIPGLSEGRPSFAPASGGDGAAVTIENLNITGIWDMTDPLATRKLAKKIDDAVTEYKKGYK